jgi:hypothetical protein
MVRTHARHAVPDVRAVDLVSGFDVRQRALGWLISEGWDTGGAPCARACTLIDLLTEARDAGRYENKEGISRVVEAHKTRVAELEGLAKSVVVTGYDMDGEYTTVGTVPLRRLAVAVCMDLPPDTLGGHEDRCDEASGEVDDG